MADPNPQIPPTTPTTSGGSAGGSGGGPTTSTGAGGMSWATIIQYVLFSGLGIASLVVIYWAMSRTGGGFMASLNDRNGARGLITFLIAFTTVALAVILVLASILSSGDDHKQRFEQGREIFTTLIGILGTIVGFYFGSTQTAAPAATPPAAAAPTVAVAPAPIPTGQLATARVSTLTPKGGETITITSFVNVGTPPYTYSITFEPNVIPAVRDVPSREGFIREEIPIPAGLAADTPVKFRIDVNDSRGNTVSYNDRQAHALRIASP